MQRSSLIAVLLLLLAVVGVACSAPPASTPVPANAGSPVITISTNPNPPNSLTETQLIVDVRGADGDPLPGASVNILTDMIGHSMGLIEGPATDQGEGRYAALVPFLMAGDWQVTIEVRDAQKNLLLRQDYVLPVQ